MCLEGVVASFIFELRTFFTVVVVNIFMRCPAVRAANNLGDACFFGYYIDQLKRLIMFFPVFLQDFFVIFLSFFLVAGFSCNGSLGSTWKSL